MPADLVVFAMGGRPDESLYLEGLRMHAAKELYNIGDSFSGGRDVYKRQRLENEYNVEIRLENLPYEHIRWIANKESVDIEKLTGTSDMKKVKDMRGNPLLLFVNAWSVGMTLDRNEGLERAEFSRN